MDENEFATLRPGDRIKTRAGWWATVRPTTVVGHFAGIAAHFDGDPDDETFTVWASVIIEFERKEAA